MVEYCRSAFTRGTFLVGELRDLSAHERGRYDVVVAGSNLLDVATHEERPHVLAELRRVLADGGVLYFSTHNRNSSDALRQARSGPELRLTASPLRLLRALASYAVGTVNHIRLARHQRFETDYAIINDSAHRFGLLHHYITRAAQERQLEQARFEVVAVYGMDGRRLAATDGDAQFTELHFVARAAGTPELSSPEAN
jgi:SAM-dependent methyltransferase